VAQSKTKEIHVFIGKGSLVSGKDLLLRVAKLSFEERKNNTEIADILLQDKILESKSTAGHHVQELVEEAGRWLMQEHARLAAINATATPEHKLAADLCRKFGLLDARVVPGGDLHASTEYVSLMKKYAQAAADYFDDVANEAEEHAEELHVLVSGGQPILDMVSSLIDRKRPNVHYYAAAMIGRGSMTWAPHVGSETNATVAWSRSGRLPRHLCYGTVPPYDIAQDDLDAISDKQRRHEFGRDAIGRQMRNLASSRYVTDTLNMMNDKVNMAFAGLGIPHASRVEAAHIERLTMTGLLKPFGIDPELLAKEGAVGDISYCLFDQKGQGRPSWKFFITAGEGTDHEGVDFYRQLVADGKKVIVIGGTRKEAALKPGVEAKLFNVLITDAFTAKGLLAG
jgi:DNA-binding transcriptional regulator LsrR (DeoR family)